jgi:hypothetical protein
VIKTIFATSLVAAGLFLAGAGQPAQAAWVCGPAQCVWVENYTGVVAPYASAWAAPLYPGCVWKRGFFGRWRMICP